MWKDGNKHRANIYSSLAMNLAHCSGLTSESYISLPDLMREERRRCFWSIFLLKRLHGADGIVLDFSGDEDFPLYPTTAGSPSGKAQSIEGQPPLGNSSSSGDHKDLGVLAYAIQMSEV